jgi:hypothetical protein
MYFNVSHLTPKTSCMQLREEENVKEKKILIVNCCVAINSSSFESSVGASFGETCLQAWSNIGFIHY